MSVRTPEGFVRKSTWQVAYVRRPLVSASHIIHAGSDLFIGNDEAYIMNKKMLMFLFFTVYPCFDVHHTRLGVPQISKGLHSHLS